MVRAPSRISKPFSRLRKLMPSNDTPIRFLSTTAGTFSIETCSMRISRSVTGATQTGPVGGGRSPIKLQVAAADTGGARILGCKRYVACPGIDEKSNRHSIDQSGEGDLTTRAGAINECVRRSCAFEDGSRLIGAFEDGSRLSIGVAAAIGNPNDALARRLRAVCESSGQGRVASFARGSTYVSTVPRRRERTTHRRTDAHDDPTAAVAAFPKRQLIGVLCRILVEAPTNLPLSLSQVIALYSARAGTAVSKSDTDASMAAIKATALPKNRLIWGSPLSSRSMIIQSYAASVPTSAIVRQRQCRHGPHRGQMQSQTIAAAKAKDRWETRKDAAANSHRWSA